MSWRKEKREHPWATEKQAKRIASDHKHKEHKKPASHHKGLFNQKVPLQHAPDFLATTKHFEDKALKV